MDVIKHLNLGITALLTSLLTSLMSLPSFADLTPISDSELSHVDGQAIALILDDVYVTGEDVTLTLDFASDTPLVFTHFYWVGHDSARKGSEVYGGNVGSNDDPYFINTQEESITLVNGDVIEATTLVAAFPEGRYNNGDDDLGKMDLGALMTLEHVSGNIDETWLLFNGMNLDGTYFKYWAPENGGLALSGEINFHADELIFQTASINNAPSDNLNTAWKITDFDLYLPLGHSLYQPATLTISDEQQIVFEIEAVNANTAEKFYTAPTGYLTAGNITINDWDAGASSISGVQIQHLKVQTHDL